MSRDGVIKLDQSTVAGRYRQHVHVSERNEWRYRGWEFTGVMPLSFEAAGRVGNADHLTRGIERRRDPHAAPRFRRSSLCGLLYRVPDELPPRGGAPRDGEKADQCSDGTELPHVVPITTEQNRTNNKKQ